MKTWKVTYVYEDSGLLLAYGISFLCTLVCAVVGLYAFFINDASYQNIFSTFIRASNELEIRSRISPRDLGSDPLPKDLAKTAVTLTRRDIAEGAEFTVAPKANSDELELQHLRLDGTETLSDRGSSTVRHSFDVAQSVRGAS